MGEEGEEEETKRAGGGSLENFTNNNVCPVTRVTIQDVSIFCPYVFCLFSSSPVTPPAPTIHSGYELVRTHYPIPSLNESAHILPSA